MNTFTTPGSRLNRAGGISLMVIAVLHTVVTTTTYWGDWITGALRDRTASPTSLAAFWAQPGGFAVTMFLLGLLIVVMTRTGSRVPTACGWALLAWCALCVFLIGVSGFVFGFVPAGLLIVADIQYRRSNN